ncbi:MAG: flippase-like domain-containing protein [Candidatus Woesearchaeota archaeon]|nr:flippase-like domain-containing protein [Candidatus Woesearchaeota archaeon]
MKKLQPERKQMDKKFALKFMFTLFLFFLIFQRLDLDKFINLLSKINLQYILIVFGIWISSVMISSIKWKLIMNHYRINVNVLEAFDLYLIGTFFNNFLPTSIGGDSYKFIHLSKKFRAKKMELLSSILLERLFGLITIVSFIVVFGLVLAGKLGLNPLIFAAITLACAIGYAFLIKFRNIKSASKNKAIQKAIDGYNTLMSFNDKPIFFISFIISIIFLIISILAYHFGFIYFSSSVPLIYLFLFVPLISLVGLIPLTINSLGLKEGAAIFLFSMIGIDAEITLSVYLLVRILLMMFSLIGGIRYLTHKRT